MARLLLAAAGTAGLLAVSLAWGQPTPAPPADQPKPTLETPAPAWCLKPFAETGLPFHRSDTQSGLQTQVCRRGYALSFNRETHNPDWVAEKLTAFELKGKAKRRDNFAADTEALGADSATLDEYAKSGYDRGHQAPAADAKFSQPVMDESFFLSNMAPQVGPRFNRGEWKYLEETVRAWILCGGHKTLIVFTGPIYDGSLFPGMGVVMASGPNKTPTRVRVPDAFFKIVYDVDTDRTVAFVLKNNKDHEIGDVSPYLTSIRDIEAATGLDFFRKFTRRRQNQLELNKGVVWGHDANCKGGAED